MASKPFAWSYSALTGFETCPRQHHEMRIKKAWPDPPGEVQQWGKEAHKLIENRIGMGKPLPDFLKFAEPIIQKLEKSEGYVQPEYKLALNAQLQPVPFFAERGAGPEKQPWVRAVGDVIKMHGTSAFALDWKFGKFRDGDAQLRLQSAIMFCHHEHLEKVGVMYAWMQDKRTTVRTFARADVPGIWQEFMPRVNRMETAIKNGNFPPNPSGLCKKHCHVKSCEFWGKGAY